MKKIIMLLVLTSTTILAFDAGEKMHESTLPGATGMVGFLNWGYTYMVEIEIDNKPVYYLNLQDGKSYKDKELKEQYPDEELKKQSKMDEKIKNLKEQIEKDKSKTINTDWLKNFNAQFSDEDTFVTTTLLKANVSRYHIPVFLKTTLNVDTNVSDSERMEHVLLDPNSGHLNIRFDLFNWVFRKYEFDTIKLKDFNPNHYDSYGLSVQLGTKIEKYSDEYKKAYAPNGDFFVIPYLNLLGQTDLSSYLFDGNDHNRYGSLIAGLMLSTQSLPEKDINNLLPDRDLGKYMNTGSLFFSFDLSESAALKLTHSFELGNPSFRKTQFGIELRK